MENYVQDSPKTWSKHILHIQILQGVFNQKIQMLPGLKWDSLKKHDKRTSWAELANLQAMNRDQILKAVSLPTIQNINF